MKIESPYVERQSAQRIARRQLEVAYVAVGYHQTCRCLGGQS